VQLRIPLLRDRGFRQWGLERDISGVAVRILRAQWREVQQQLRHEVEQTYVALHEALANQMVAREATLRYEALVAETRELIRLKVIPEYQLYAAVMELELQREDEQLKAEKVATTREYLLELTGGKSPLPNFIGGVGPLLGWAGEQRLPETGEGRQWLQNRGFYLARQTQVERSELNLAILREENQASLSLEMAGGWQGEDPSHLWADGTELSEKRLGGQVALVWTRPWGFRKEKNLERQAWAGRQEARASLAGLELSLTRERETARIEFNTSLDRLKLAGRAVEAARRNMDSERERYRLGEGRSRSVLDAQKDLIKSVQRQVDIATRLLLAHSDFNFTIGYPGKMFRGDAGLRKEESTHVSSQE
jgi:outer membrane protein TolC